MHTPSNRREFLRTTALTGIGVWTFGSTVQGQSRSPNEKLNIACIGVGGRGASNVAGVRGENIVAMCDVDEARAARSFEQFPQAKKYQDFRRMLDELKTIDAVVVSTPDHVHAPAAMMAMQLGKHLYCEKPMAHNIAEVRKMAAAAAKMKLATQMGNQGHSGEKYRQVVELVKSGAIGAVREAHGWCSKNFSADARPTDTPPVPPTLNWDLWLGPAPERPYHPAYVPFEWRGWRDFGTGGVGDMACHILDPIFWSLDLRYPRSVETEGEPVTSEGFSKQFTAVYQFDARGNLPPVKLTWRTGHDRPPVELPSTVKVPSQGQLLVGDRGMLLSAHGGGLVALLPQEKYAGFKAPEPFLPVSPGHHEEWILACKTGSPTGSNFDYAADLTTAVLLANVAQRVGQKLEWDHVNMKATNCPAADEHLRRVYRAGWEV